MPLGKKPELPGFYYSQREVRSSEHDSNLLWLMLISGPRPIAFVFFITTVDFPREVQLLLIRENLSKNVDSWVSVCLRMCGCSYTCVSVKLSNFEHGRNLSYVLCDFGLVES